MPLSANAVLELTELSLTRVLILNIALLEVLVIRVVASAAVTALSLIFTPERIKLASP